MPNKLFEPKRYHHCEGFDDKDCRCVFVLTLAMNTTARQLPVSTYARSPLVRLGRYVGSVSGVGQDGESSDFFLHHFQYICTDFERAQVLQRCASMFC